MEIRLIPVPQPMTGDDVAHLIQSGWVIAGRVVVRPGAQIADPTHPETMVDMVECNVWVRAQPMIPAGLVMKLLLEMNDIDEICKQLFGGTREQLKPKPLATNGMLVM